LDTLQGVRVFLGWSIRKMIEGELPESRAKGGAYIAGVLLRAFELSDLEDRLKALEERSGV
jgi:hypothetical protein